MRILRSIIAATAVADRAPKLFIHTRERRVPTTPTGLKASPTRSIPTDDSAGTTRGFSSAIGKNYGTGWQQWRDYYVASPDTWDPKGRGGVVTTQGFNGGVLRNQTVANNYPNAGYFVVKEIEGRRWIWELREHGTAPTAQTLPEMGQKWPCDPVYEVCT
ncbi:uncharacterized protein CC84DRAFT_1174507 [Paraphaeosphaeria sporulosa]|uniref:Uncharacterized protein n=1 Tax=Paraphaeosphaeria sporulosa TaxID=1460663 RepID=A0A177CQW4_9PLEO|nr:uncharacterized protein CC84DRAFT_1174507 [Paraphaeosphaeria sporulosa]OAG09157.1 hypothetical protein CC84DRAFT_1174507 [Paraphaeosphaeria sporulosa]